MILLQTREGSIEVVQTGARVLFLICSTVRCGLNTIIVVRAAAAGDDVLLSKSDILLWPIRSNTQITHTRLGGSRVLFYLG